MEYRSVFLTTYRIERLIWTRTKFSQKEPLSIFERFQKITSHHFGGYMAWENILPNNFYRTPIYGILAYFSLIGWSKESSFRLNNLDHSILRWTQLSDWSVHSRLMKPTFCSSPPLHSTFLISDKGGGQKRRKWGKTSDREDDEKSSLWRHTLGHSRD